MEKNDQSVVKNYEGNDAKDEDDDDIDDDDDDGDEDDDDDTVMRRQCEKKDIGEQPNRHFSYSLTTLTIASSLSLQFAFLVGRFSLSLFLFCAFLCRHIFLRFSLSVSVSVASLALVSFLSRFCLCFCTFLSFCNCLNLILLFSLCLSQESVCLFV